MKVLCYSIAFVVLVAACSGSSESIKFKQYYLKGEQLYEDNCSNCHQANGRGFALLYPPLDSADFLLKNKQEVLCLIRHGRSSEINVNGKIYNQPMPAFRHLTDIEIAQVATYIYNTWSNNQGLIDVKEASPVLRDCPPSQ